MTSRRRDRERKPGRRAPFREPKPVILVLCEGEKTEPQYLYQLEASYRKARIKLEIVVKHDKPKKLVERAKRLKDEAEKAARSERDVNLAYDSVWCVFDIDNHSLVPEAIRMAQDNGIDLAVSNPCFELWLLLHFRDSPGMHDRHTIQRMLKKFVPEYDKGVRYSDYENNHQNAVKRAAHMDRAAHEANEPGRNPSTGVYRLTAIIRGDDPPGG